MRFARWLVALVAFVACEDERLLAWANDGGAAGAGPTDTDTGGAGGDGGDAGSAGQRASAGDGGVAGEGSEPEVIPECEAPSRTLASAEELSLDAAYATDQAAGILWEANGGRYLAALDENLDALANPTWLGTAEFVSEPALTWWDDGFLLVFGNDELGNDEHVFALPVAADEVAPDYGQSWQISTLGGANFAPRAAAADGTYFVAWQHDSSLATALLDATGDVSESVVLEPSQALPTPRSVAFAAQGPVVLSAVASTASHELHLFDSDGNYRSAGAELSTFDGALAAHEEQLLLAAQTEEGVALFAVDDAGALEDLSVIPDPDVSRVALHGSEFGWLVAFIGDSGTVNLAWLDREAELVWRCVMPDEGADQVAVARLGASYVVALRREDLLFELDVVAVSAEP